MDDFLDFLYTYLTEERLPRSACSRTHLLRSKQETAALDALLATFSEEQTALYLDYEAVHNALSVLEFQQLFRETFSLAREIYH